MTAVIVIGVSIALIGTFRTAQQVSLDGLHRVPTRVL